MYKYVLQRLLLQISKNFKVCCGPEFENDFIQENPVGNQNRHGMED
jgi:hypothetical protein